MPSTIGAISPRERLSALTYLETSIGCSGGTSRAWSRETPGWSSRCSITCSPPSRSATYGHEGSKHREVAGFGNDQFDQLEGRPPAVDEERGQAGRQVPRAGSCRRAGRPEERDQHEVESHPDGEASSWGNRRQGRQGRRDERVAEDDHRREPEEPRKQQQERRHRCFERRSEDDRDQRRCEDRARKHACERHERRGAKRLERLLETRALLAPGGE